MGRGQRFRGQPVGAVGQKAPAHAADALRQCLAAGKPGPAVIGGHGFSASGHQLLAGLGIAELGAAGIGKGLFRRIGNLDDMAMDAAAGGGAVCCRQLRGDP